jgi:hypothetical protein
MTEITPFNRNLLLSSLMKIPHGNLAIFVNNALPAARTDPEMFAHLIAWNNKEGKVRDSKVAFPVIGIRGLDKKNGEFAENAVAHIVNLDPRDCLRAYTFSKELTKTGNIINGGHRRLLEYALKKYLEIRETNNKWFDRTVISHRKAVIGLYAVSHKKPSPRAQGILFDKNYPNGSIFQIVRDLKNKSSLETAGLILKYKIPFQIAVGAAAKAKDSDVILALIEGMTGNELINSTSMLKKFGVFNSPSLKALKAAYDAAIERAKKDTKVNIFKASKASEVLDEKTAKKVISVQRSQEKNISNIEGNVLIEADASDSMGGAIEKAKMVAAVIASRIKGKVWLIFFKTEPRSFEVSGKSYDEIAEMAKNIKASGRTSIGCPLDYILDKGEEVNCIVIVSDGCDNEPPFFHDVYPKYVSRFGFEPSVYLLHVPGAPNILPGNCRSVGIHIEE